MRRWKRARKNARLGLRFTYAAIDELQLPRSDQLFNLRLARRGLICPPALKEGLLHINELAVFIGKQGHDIGRDDGGDVCMLDRVIGTIVILIHRL